MGFVKMGDFVLGGACPRNPILQFFVISYKNNR